MWTAEGEFQPIPTSQISRTSQTFGCCGKDTEIYFKVTLFSITMSAVYRGITGAVGKFVPEKMKPFWNHPAGIYLIKIVSFIIAHANRSLEPIRLLRHTGICAIFSQHSVTRLQWPCAVVGAENNLISMAQSACRLLSHVYTSYNNCNGYNM